MDRQTIHGLRKPHELLSRYPAAHLRNRKVGCGPLPDVLNCIFSDDMHESGILFALMR